MATQFNLAPLSLKRTQAHTDAHRQARPHPSHQHLNIVLRILADKTPQCYMTWACCGIAQYSGRLIFWLPTTPTQRKRTVEPTGSRFEVLPAFLTCAGCPKLCLALLHANMRPSSKRPVPRFKLTPFGCLIRPELSARCPWVRFDDVHGVSVAVARALLAS